MNRFFRHLRIKSIEGTKVRRYFVYAIGEILLVVIGILIALQVNNWNEGRKENELQKQYLLRLLADNQQDLETFSNSIKDMNQGIRTIEIFSSMLKDVESEDSSLVKSANEYFKYGSIYAVFASAQSTFNDLASTGNFQIISNPELRDAIVKHYEKQQQIKERVTINTEWALPLDASFAFELDIMKFEPMTGFLYPERDVQRKAIELRRNKDHYITNAAVHYWVHKDMITFLDDLIIDTKEMIRKINLELNSNYNID